MVPCHDLAMSQCGSGAAEDVDLKTAWIKQRACSE
jgi:hypothetical protein